MEIKQKTHGLRNPLFRWTGCALAILLVLVLTPPPVFARNESQTIVVGVFDLDPLCCIHQRHPGGMFIDLLEEIAKRENWSLEYLIDNLEQHRSNLHVGAIDLLMGAPHDKEMADRLEFSRETIISTWGQVYASKRVEIQTLLDLAGLTVGIVRGDPHAMELRNIVGRLNIQCRFVEFKQYGEIVNALKSGWIDAGALDRFFGTSHENQDGIRKTPIIFAPIELRFAVSKGADRKILTVLDYHLNILKKDSNSVYYRFLQDAFGKTDDARLVTALGVGVAILGSFLLVSTFIGIVLRQQVKSRTAELTAKNRELGRELVQRRIAESASRRSEARYRSVFENTGTATIILEADMTIAKINAMAESISAGTKKEIEGKAKISEFVADESAEILEVFQRDRHPADQTPWETEFRMIDRQRRKRDVFVRIGHVPATGQWVVSIIDMTDRKRNEAQRLQLATVIEQSSESVFIMDTQRVIQYVNPAFETMSGYLQHEAMGRKPDFLHSDAHSPDTLNQIELSIASGNTWTGRVSNLNKNGQRFIAETKISPLRDPQGKVTGYVNIKRDVTAEVQLEDQLVQAQKLQAIGQLAGGIAHDFNNILAGIMGFTELAMMQAGPDKAIARHLNGIFTGCRRARDLVNQILTFSRRQSPEKRSLKLQPVLVEAMNLVRATIPSSIEIQTDFLKGKSVVSADPTQIHQMVLNLCTNAAHAMASHGGVLRVGLSETRFSPKTIPPFVGLKEGPYLILTISDEGHGMSREVREKLFDPFFTTKEIGRGTGLGLSVVHGIVKSHGGAIDVESVPGKGSTFRIYLPVVGATASAQPVQGPQPRGGNETILFVDDEPLLGVIAKESLEKMGYSVVKTTSSTEALQWVETDPARFNLVITDRTMPNLSGIELSRKIKAIRKDLPVIMCTGFSEAGIESVSEAAGIGECLEKPLERVALAAAVRRALGGNRWQHHVRRAG